MYSARIDRENISNTCGSGKNWKNKLTVPKAPNITQKKKNNRVKEPFNVRLNNRHTCTPNTDKVKR